MRPLVALAAMALVGCHGSSAGPNPPQLWLSLNGSETRVHLVPVEPDPF
jgi:hypothetical protein